MACRSEPWEAFNYIIIIMSHQHLPQISGAPNFDYFSLKEKGGWGGLQKKMFENRKAKYGWTEWSERTQPSSLK